MPDATATNQKPDADITLYDGTTTVDLMLVDQQGRLNPRSLQRQAQNRQALKGSEGGGTYSDFEPPYIPVVQSDWSGGRGQEDFERDRSRFFDSYRANTWKDNQITLGPQEAYTFGFRNLDQNTPGSVKWQALTGSQQYLAASFTASASYTTGHTSVWIRRVGTPNDAIHVGIFNNSAGDPGTSRTSTSVSVATFGANQQQQLYNFDYADNALTGSTVYHVKVWAASGSDNATNHWEVAVNNASGNTKQSGDDSSWSAASVDLYYRVLDVDVDREVHFFEYKQGYYAVTMPDDGSTAGQLYIQGDRGAADSNAGDKSTLVDATKSWTADRYIGAVVVLTAGTGIAEPRRWRTITDNDATTLTVSPAWNITHDTTTEYVIVGSDYWIEITGHGLTAPVTDVLVSKDVIYFAQNDTVNIRRANFYNNAGTWTARYADDSTNKGTFLELVEDPVDGQQVWVADNSATTVARANAQAWGTDLTLGTGIVVGSTDSRITGLDKYGSPEVLWVLKQDSQWAVQNDIPDQIPLREMASVRSEKNGRAHLVHGVYLYFSLLHSLERYFRNNLDDVGPSQDFGLPSSRQGPIWDMVGYPGIFFCAVNGGSSNSSSILVTRGSRDWHELYRCDAVNQEIRNLGFQVVPGSAVDRLWFSQGADVISVNFPSDTTDPFRDSNYKFFHEGHVITSWMYADMQDVQKLFKSVKVFAENLTASAQVIQCDYQIDGATETSAWTALNGTFNTVPVQEVDLVSDPVASGVKGRRVRFRFRLETNDNSKSPRIKATLAEMLGKVSQKYAYSFSFRAQDNAEDLQGRNDNARVETDVTQLETWANAPTPLTFRNLHSPFDNKTVMIQSLDFNPVSNDPAAQQEVLVGSMTVVEI